METNAIARTNVKKVFNSRVILKSLGLRYPSRWEVAREVIKKRIIEARFNQDDKLAAHLSEIKVFLRRNLKRTCKCGGVMSVESNFCGNCRTFTQNTKKQIISQEKKEEIIKLYNTDMPQYEIAKAIGFSRKNIREIIKNGAKV